MRGRPTALLLEFSDGAVVVAADDLLQCAGGHATATQTTWTVAQLRLGVRVDRPCVEGTDHQRDGSGHTKQDANHTKCCHLILDTESVSDRNHPCGDEGAGNDAQSQRDQERDHGEGDRPKVEDRRVATGLDVRRRSGLAGTRRTVCGRPRREALWSPHTSPQQSATGRCAPHPKRNPAYASNGPRTRSPAHPTRCLAIRPPLAQVRDCRDMAKRKCRPVHGQLQINRRDWKKRMTRRMCASSIEDVQPCWLVAEAATMAVNGCYPSARSTLPAAEVVGSCDRCLGCGGSRCRSSSAAHLRRLPGHADGRLPDHGARWSRCRVRGAGRSRGL